MSLPRNVSLFPFIKQRKEKGTKVGTEGWKKEAREGKTSVNRLIWHQADYVDRDLL